MKRAWTAVFAAVVAIGLAVPAMAQIRGVPASVTSIAPNRPFPPGPPASVTSLGPNGFSSPCSGAGPLIPSAMGCTPTQFTSSFFFPDGRDRGPVNLRTRHHRGVTPIYVPYAYPVVVGAAPAEELEPEPEPPAPTIFERRPTTQRPLSAPVARYRPQPQTLAAPADTEPSPAEARQQIPVVLVYRDGHQQEVTNYAIVGQTLYDLGTFVAHKIPLSELNLRATVKANDDRGVEFALPASVSLD